MLALLLVAFVGREACRPCHPAQYEGHLRTGHARALRVEPDRWAFGAGLKAITYVSKDGPEHYKEHGLSYYPERKQIGITPGHADASGRRYRTLEPVATALRCFRCHSTGPLDLSVGGAIKVAEQGVQCESCHGSGGEHVKGGAPMLNPKRFSGAELNEFCGACHRRPGDVTNWTNSWNVRHEPAYLDQSACFRKGGVTCLTCHAAHRPLEREAACGSCHAQPRHRTEVAGSCTECHMPQARTNAQLTFTNHVFLEAIGDLDGAAAALRRALEQDGDLPAPGWSALASADPANTRTYYARAVEAEERVWGKDDPRVAIALNSLALTDRERGEPLLRRALAIQRKALGNTDPALATTMSNLGSLLHSAGKLEEAERLERAAVRILARRQSAELGTAYTNLADLLWTKGARLDSVAMYRKALAVDEAVYGPEHPEVAGDLTNLGLLLKELGRAREAAGLLRRALGIFERQFGPDSPQAEARKNLERD